MFMFFCLEDAETRYDIMERKALTVIQYLIEVQLLVTKNTYPTKLYINHFALENIFNIRSNALRKIARWMDRLIKYNHKVH